MKTPTRFINVFSSKGKFWSEGEVLTTRAAAVEDAEQTNYQYEYTLTDAGVLDLTSEFSEEWQDRQDADAAVDRKIDAMKAARFAGEGANHDKA